MSTEQEKSFIATIKCDNTEMLILDHISSGFLSSRDNLLSTTHTYSKDDRRMVRISRSHPSTRSLSHDMIVYFRCYEDYYNIQIRSGKHSGNYLSKDSGGFLGSFPGAGGNTTSFNMLDSNNSIITLDNLEKNSATVYLKARNAGIIKRTQLTSGGDYVYGDQPGDSVKFNLEILERNVPYPANSDPYLLYIDPIAEYEWE